MRVKFTEHEIKELCHRSVWAFYEAFGRRPSEHEQQLLSAALLRWVTEPDAPSTRLQ